MIFENKVKISRKLSFSSIENSPRNNYAERLKNMKLNKGSEDQKPKKAKKF